MHTKSIKDSQDVDREWYGNLLAPPADPERAFILNGCTYGELYRLAGRLYRFSQSLKADRPCLCLGTDDKVLMTAALLAALAGGPRLVLPYAFSRQAFLEVREVLSPACYVTDQSEYSDFPANSRVITPVSLPMDGVLPDTVPDPDETFLVLFTGGSTGIPKVWPKTPRNLFAEASYQTRSLGILKEDIFLSTVPPNHIYGLLFSVLVPLVGASCVLNGTYSFPREILKAAGESRASVLVSVPVHYRVLKTEDMQRHHLRIALSSAGVLPEEDAVHFREKTGLDITEIYGSTETGGVATRQRARNSDAWQPMTPIAWRIRDGRLCVRSDFLSPTLPRDDDGFFITADCVDTDGDGCFLLRGRADDVVKIGGKRVDMAAVQGKLKQIPGVRDAVVVALPSGRGRQHELAALVATELDVKQIRQSLSQVSEPYALPKRIAIVDDIPVAPTGKYERTAIERILRAGDQKRR